MKFIKIFLFALTLVSFNAEASSQLEQIILVKYDIPQAEVNASEIATDISVAENSKNQLCIEDLCVDGENQIFLYILAALSSFMVVIKFLAKKIGVDYVIKGIALGKIIHWINNKVKINRKKT